MIGDLVSVLKPYAYGQVVINNDKQEREIKVKILEHLPSQYGLPTDEVFEETIDVKTFDVLKKKDVKARVEEFEEIYRTVSVVIKDWVPAHWLNRLANRINPPKVVVGQRVLLWRVGDSRQYYWEELDVDMRLKPDEHYLIALNNHNDGDALNPDNSYFIEWSTRDGRLRMRTNRNNGEKAAFELDLNGKEGYAKLLDDNGGDPTYYDGNGVHINSVDTTVTMKNTAGSNVLVSGPTIAITAPTAVAINAPSVSINGDSLEVNAASTSFSGAVTFKDAVNGTKASWSVVCTAPNI